MGVRDTTVTLEYFDSIGQLEPKQISVPADAVQPIRVAPQTRCYWQSQGHWRVGRVVGQREGAYVVRSSNEEDIDIAEPDLYVRWHRRLEDPTDVLVLGGNESPYFHNCRQPFITSLVAQRAACRGMTTLLSSVVQLHEHQVEIARRVLSDPIQRYLLADEVGLGKTVEAGLILRQYLLSEPTGYVLVLAPESLRVQWVRELKQKFLVDDFAAAKIKVMSHSDPTRWVAYGNPGMLVVDEAHHLTTPSDASMRHTYDQLEALARQAPKVLLLSATPLLHNEASLLGMLHLLDPQLHDLERVEEFRALVAGRQELGRLFYTFRPDAPAFLLEEKTARLSQLFPEDSRLHDLLSEVDHAMTNVTNPKVLSDAVVAARVHISEAYRLHRRLLRTRRTAAVLDTYPVRGRRPPVPIVDVDARRRMVNVWLDSWRDLLQFESSTSQRAPIDPEAAAEIFWLFLEWSGTDLSQLKALASCCLNASENADTIPGLSAAEAQLVQTFPFSGEAQGLLNALLADLNGSGDGDRISQALAYLTARPRAKVVVFSRFAAVAERLRAALATTVGDGAVAAQTVGMDAGLVAEELDRFENDGFCTFLVCDSSAEEGRNLQFADFLLHVDVPLNPNRLEQRIGRMDRYSARPPVACATFQDEPSMQPGYHSAWIECLARGFRIFEQSISSLQYAVDRLLADLRRRTFEEGVDGLLGCVELVRATLVHEVVAIAEQDVLDGVETLDGERSLFDGLDRLENQWKHIKRAAEDWISDAKGNLRFEKIEDFRNRGIVTFAINPEGREPTLDNMPLVAWDVLAESFGGVVRRPGSFHREAALGRRDTRVFRIGEPFVEALARYTQWDDRGRAFGMWRFRESRRGHSEFVGLRCDYVVEGDATGVEEAIRKHGASLDMGVAQRRVDACFPPIGTTIWLDVALEEIRDTGLLGMLGEPYDPGKGDVHLARARWWAVEQVIGRDAYEPFVRNARSESQRLLLERVDLSGAVVGARDRAERQAQLTLEQLRVRSQAVVVTGSSADWELEADLAAAVEVGVSNPLINLDSIGFVILSGNMLRGPAFGLEGDADGR